MYSDPSDTLSNQLDFPGMEARPNLNSKLMHAFNDRGSATDSASRAIERRKEAVTPPFDALAAETSDLGTDQAIVVVDERPPSCVADASGAAR